MSCTAVHRLAVSTLLALPSVAGCVQPDMEDFGYDKLIKAVDLQRLDLGIAMSHFELTAWELGLVGRWVNQPPSMGSLPERIEYVQTWITS